MRIRSDCVGKRVRVYWDDEGEWFSGCVQEIDDEQGHYVLYDDGDERWESPEQLVRFDPESSTRPLRDDGGDGDAEQKGDNPREHSTDRAPRMMEPPASPGDEYTDDDGEYGNDEEEESDLVHAAYNEGDEDMENIDLATVPDAQYARIADSEEDAEEHTDSGDDDGEQSVAVSEVPITFERIHSRQSSARNGRPSPSSSSRSIPVPASGRRLPARGTLRGKVLRATNLPCVVQKHASQITSPPSAFVKVAFVEAGESAHTNIMLRCKNVLATTSVAHPSNHPVWNAGQDDEEEEVDSIGEAQDDDDDEVNGGFQMQVVPPRTSPKEPPAWLQLRGDILFSVYSASCGSDVGGDSGRRQVHDFIGQAVLSLRDVLREVLYISPCITRHLTLQSRQGKPVEANQSNANGGNMPEILVSFRFLPAYDEDVRQRMRSASSRTTRTTSVTTTAAPDRKSFSASEQKQHKAKPRSTQQSKHTSSSCVNRRKFEKQVDQQNAAFAKRLEGAEARRARHAEHAKAQAKSKQPIPYHGTMKLDHKASSGINRTKVQQQINQENKAMDKRLRAIIRDEKKPSAKHRGESKRGGRSDGSDEDEIGFDDLDKDKALARDKRHQKLREQDFLMQKAQSKYQQQNQVVEEVMALQSELAELRSKVFAAKTSVTRLDILNKKDEHVRNCLRSAAESVGRRSSSHPVAQRSSGDSTASTKRKVKETTSTSADDTDTSGAIARQKKEHELLKQEAESLHADKQMSGKELNKCNQLEQELDDELHKLSSQLRFVQTKRAFQLRMNSKAGGAELQFAREMKKKQQRLELSRDEEEQWTLYQVQQELTQLQIAVQVLKERSRESSMSGRTSTSSSAVACEYLQKKIGKQTQKLDQLAAEQAHYQREYESLLVSGEQETLRKQVHELQHTLFLCQSQAKHVKAAQRHAKFTDESLKMAFNSKVFQEQTETEILFKKK